MKWESVGGVGAAVAQLAGAEAAFSLRAIFNAMLPPARLVG
ncbi:hypothetical protein C4J99_1123 [Pseudomonas synxantha]|nr:hypothetical protein C4J99_1123 [Pseudomonas synxantha]